MVLPWCCSRFRQRSPPGMQPRGSVRSPGHTRLEETRLWDGRGKPIRAARPRARGPSRGGAARQAFRGVWRIQEGASGSRTARLSYALFVRPQAWLPVRLIQARAPPLRRPAEAAARGGLRAALHRGLALWAGVRGPGCTTAQWWVWLAWGPSTCAGFVCLCPPRSSLPTRAPGTTGGGCAPGTLAGHAAAFHQSSCARRRCPALGRTDRTNAPAQGRIEGEVRNNLAAVRAHSERVWALQLSTESAA